mmetsp:Transcript_8979/g.12591  ORF Transcript_8979/g.12591 Transcript_8979/m.12591 type:complete len:504 (+) Transcript_8979:57-1568(+)
MSEAYSSNNEVDNGRMESPINQYRENRKEFEDLKGRNLNSKNVSNNNKTDQSNGQRMNESPQVIETLEKDVNSTKQNIKNIDEDKYDETKIEKPKKDLKRNHEETDNEREDLDENINKNRKPRIYTEKRILEQNSRSDSEDQISSKTLFIGNLNERTDSASLEEFCDKFGEVTNVKLVRDRETGHSRGFAFVTFANYQICKAARKELQMAYLDGQTLRVEEARAQRYEQGDRDAGPYASGGQHKFKARTYVNDNYRPMKRESREVIRIIPRREYRGSGSVINHERREYDKQSDRYEKHIPSKRSAPITKRGSSRDQTYIEERISRRGPAVDNYNNYRSSRHHAPATSGSRSPPNYVQRKQTRDYDVVEKFQGSGPYKEKPREKQVPPQSVDPCTVFLGGLSVNVTPERIIKQFERCGNIESVRIFSEKGFGFLTFTTIQAANQAIHFFDKTELEGRIIKVAENVPKQRVASKTYPSERNYSGNGYGSDRPSKRRAESRRVQPY